MKTENTELRLSKIRAYKEVLASYEKELIFQKKRKKEMVKTALLSGNDWVIFEVKRGLNQTFDPIIKTWTSEIVRIKKLIRAETK